MSLFIRAARCAALVSIGTLGACAGDDSLGDMPTLSGQIAGWEAGDGYAVDVNVQLRSGMSRDLPPNLPIDASGRFSLTLPGEAVLSQVGTPAKVQAECNGVLVSEPSEALVVYLLLTDTAPHMYKIHQLHEETPGTVPYMTGTSVSYVYVDRALSISGSVSCQIAQDRSGTTTYDVRYQKGWNREIRTFGKGVQTITTGAPPEGLQWVRQFALP